VSAPPPTVATESTAGADTLTRREELPRSGTGLVVSGSILLGVGTVQTVVGIALASAKVDEPGRENAPRYPGRVWVPTMVSGLLQVAIGAPLMGAGVTRNRRYKALVEDNELSMQLQPIAGLSGVGLGIRMRL
jgi:hypothetical protein